MTKKLGYGRTDVVQPGSESKKDQIDVTVLACGYGGGSTKAIQVQLARSDVLLCPSSRRDTGCAGRRSGAIHQQPWPSDCCHNRRTAFRGLSLPAPSIEATPLPWLEHVPQLQSWMTFYMSRRPSCVRCRRQWLWRHFQTQFMLFIFAG